MWSLWVIDALQGNIVYSASPCVKQYVGTSYLLLLTMLLTFDVSTRHLVIGTSIELPVTTPASYEGVI